MNLGGGGGRRGARANIRFKNYWRYFRKYKTVNNVSEKDNSLLNLFISFLSSFSFTFWISSSFFASFSFFFVTLFGKEMWFSFSL